MNFEPEMKTFHVDIPPCARVHQVNLSAYHKFSVQLKSVNAARRDSLKLENDIKKKCPDVEPFITERKGIVN